MSVHCHKSVHQPVFQWGNTIKSPWVCTVTSRYPTGKSGCWHHDPISYSVTHYPDTDLSSPYPILVMPSTRLGSDKHNFYKSLGLTRPANRTLNLPHARPALCRFGHCARSNPEGGAGWLVPGAAAASEGGQGKSDSVLLAPLRVPAADLVSMWRYTQTSIWETHLRNSTQI